MPESNVEILRRGFDGGIVRIQDFPRREDAFAVLGLAPPG